jgi:hypothetical protein
MLEDRSVPAAISTLSQGFNGTAIPAGDSIWFNSEFNVSGLGQATSVTLHVTDQSVSYTAGGTSYNVSLPDSVILISNANNVATTAFNATSNSWVTNLPLNFGGNAFLGGGILPVATALPGGIKPVSWKGAFTADKLGVQVGWHWGAAAYSSFSSDPSALSVKPLDGNGTLYNNNDHAGTPEAYKSSVVNGATGGGGNNWTGNLGPGANVTPTLYGAPTLYPFPSSNPLTSVVFNESDVLAGGKLDTTNGTFEVWYTDEHALALGVRQVNVVTASGTTTTNYPIAPLTSDPGVAQNPALGATATSGDQAGIDPSGRLISPSLYITDTTTNANSLSGDWQYGGTAIAPNAVFGAWKGFVKTVNRTTATPTVSVLGDADPAQNHWNLGAGSDTPPAGTANDGYGAEIRWNLSALGLLPGHNYRFYVIVHDGDQNKTGGDCGQIAFNFTSPIPPVQQANASLSGVVNLDNGGGVLTPLGGVLVTLTGTTTSGQQVNVSMTTNPDGTYGFGNLQAGTYTITETVPQGDSAESASAGTVNGTTDGNVDSTFTVISGINLGAADNGINFNFTNYFVPQV